MTAAEAAGLRAAVVAHLLGEDASDDVQVTPEPDGRHLVRAPEDEWLAVRLPMPGVPAALFELRPQPERTGRRRPRPALVLTPDGASYPLHLREGFGAFASAVGPQMPAETLARLLTHFFGQGMELVLVSPDELTAVGLEALAAAGVSFAPPSARQRERDWTVRFLSAAPSERMVGNALTTDLREWTLTATPGGPAAWEARTFASLVPGALRSTARREDRS
jgi:hypothetical protein